MSSSNQQRPPLSFEFTKRKRWADLLITELTDNLILVLSPSCKILYCGTAVTDLLGWKDTELVDCNFLSIVDDQDQALFKTCFEESINSGQELFVHSRLRNKNLAAAFGPKPSLFEIKARPHFMNNELVCFFVAARLYHSRNTVALNAMLDLKIENERLQQRIRDLKNMLRNPASSSAHTRTNLQSPVAQQSMTIPVEPVASARTSENLYGSPTATDEDSAEDGSKKKKQKKSSTEQYVCVTCGRTDSPEWRKGPLGPKTLCNACGLRWAKQMRKGDETESVQVEV